MLFANVDDPNETIESIVNFIMANSGSFKGVETWEDFQEVVHSYTQTDKKNASKEISVMSWRKFYRLFNKSFQKCRQMFTNQLGDGVRLRDEIANINKNDVMVIDVAKLDEESQGFVFGDVMRAVYNLKLGASKRPDEEIPDRIIIFIDELNKYASSDVPKSSPILHQLLDITERGRSLGIVLFGAEQFSVRHKSQFLISGRAETERISASTACLVQLADMSHNRTVSDRHIDVAFVLKTPDIFMSIGDMVVAVDQIHEKSCVHHFEYPLCSVVFFVLLYSL